MEENFVLQPIINEPLPQVRNLVYQRLRRAILDGQLKPESRLIERKLAEQLGVSRTPVREAIRMLELEGLVSDNPKSGAVVARINVKEVFEIYRIRAVLEGLAARMAAENINREELERLSELVARMEQLSQQGEIDDLGRVHQEFNDLIYRAAGSPRLYSMITSLVESVNRYIRVGYCFPGRVAEATAEHLQLVEALRGHDGELAEQVAREHIENSRRAYVNEINKQPRD